MSDDRFSDDELRVMLTDILTQIGSSSQEDIEVKVEQAIRNRGSDTPADQPEVCPDCGLPVAEHLRARVGWRCRYLRSSNGPAPADQPEPS